jgi:nitroimidazol reductase NimA-like FMN-containing flavoprotein (pyridoxamine 5'-phosphate oxidase superfamily)
MKEDTVRPQRFGRRIAMTEEERDVFLEGERTARVASVSADGFPHVTPLWFVWADGELWLYSITRSRRWAHLSSNPAVAVVVDAGEEYTDLRGVEVSGRARVVGAVPRGQEPHAQLERIEQLHSQKYTSGSPFAPDGRHAWIAIEPTAIVSWDFRKLSP